MTWVDTVNACIQQVSEALTVQAAAERHAQSLDLEPAERLAAAEWVPHATQDVSGTLGRLQSAWPAVHLAATGTWVETWPEAEGERRRLLLVSRGRDDRVRRRGSRVSLVYAAPAPELLAAVQSLASGLVSVREAAHA